MRQAVMWPRRNGRLVRITFGGFISILFTWLVIGIVLIKNAVEVDLQSTDVDIQDSVINKEDEDLVRPTQLFHIKNLSRDATVKFCPNLSFSDIDLASGDDNWGSVATDKIYSYSAYFDERNGRLVRIISLASRSRSLLPKLFCQLWSVLADKSVDLAVTAARVDMINECHGARYCAAMILCQVGENIPDYVSLVAGDQCQKAPSTATLKVNDDRQRSLTSNFTVCLGGPLKFGYNNVNNFVEWLEVNSMFGADKFVMYNHSASSDIDPYVKRYVQENKLEFRQWKIPVEGTDNIKNYGQLAVINDCIYRNMYSAKYVVMADIDEFIVPRAGNNWWAIIRHKACRNLSNIILRSTFFHMEWPDDPVYSKNINVTDLGLSTLLKTKRAKVIFKPGTRSKYIVSPTVVECGGIHTAYRVIKSKTGGKRCSPEPEVALVHHYRQWDDKLTAGNFIEDRTMHKYERDIIARAWPRHRSVAKETHNNRTVR